MPGPDGDGVASVFDVVHEAGGTTALFAGKEKFATFDRSWPDAIDEFEVDGDADALVDDAIEDLTSERRRFTFLHLELPDEAGHASGWLSPAYVDAVAETDRLLGEVLDAVDASPRLSKRLVVVLTADHGGPPGREAARRRPTTLANYRDPVPRVGPRHRGRATSTSSTPTTPTRATAQPAYDGPQPVRNGDLANLVTDVLGLGPVPGSELDADAGPGLAVGTADRAGWVQPARTPRISSVGAAGRAVARRGGGLWAVGVDRDDVGELLVEPGDPRRPAARRP